MKTELESIVYVNGEFLPRTAAKISVFDQGLIFGDGVFDTLVARNGYVFKLDEHAARLERSARAVRIDIRKSRDEVKSLIVETVKRNGLRDAYVKIIVTRGIGQKPILGRGDVPAPTIIIFAVPPVSVVSTESMRKGAKALSTTIKRAPPETLDPRIKSINYLPNMLMRREAVEGGADEAISYGSDGNVAEGGADNIWIVRDRSLFTPRHGVLEGITRETVFEIARDLGLEATETNVSKFDLYQAEEIFLSSTAGGIIPITEVDRRKVGSGRIGPTTRKIMAAYDAMLTKGVHGTAVYGD